MFQQTSVNTQNAYR